MQIHGLRRRVETARAGGSGSGIIVHMLRFRISRYVAAAILAALTISVASSDVPAATTPATASASNWEIATAKPDAAIRLYAGPSLSSHVYTQLNNRDYRGFPTTLSVVSTKIVGTSAQTATGQTGGTAVTSQTGGTGVTGGTGKLWLRVVTASYQQGGPISLDNKLVWVPASEVDVSHTGYSVSVSLSRRTLILRDHGKVKGDWTVGIGAPDSPTPTGRYEITERVSGQSYCGCDVYGPGILGLSAMQLYGPEVPGQIALHGTNDPASIGADVSNGCIHCPPALISLLLRKLPLGTPVFISG